MRPSSNPMLRRYALGVGVLGMAAGVAVALLGSFATSREDALFVALLVIATLLGELLPIRYVRNGVEQQITSSATGSIALVLVGGPAIAVGAQALASVVSDLRERKSPERVLFNLGQWVLSLLAFAAVYQLLGGSPPFGPADLGPAIAGCLVFHLVNVALVGTVAALHEGIAIGPALLRDVVTDAPLAALVLLLAPVVAVVGSFSPAALPLLLVPALAVHVASQASLRERHQAEHDGVTDLPSRSAMQRRLEADLAELRPESHLAVLFMDLDRFKEINDTLGHRYGDELLALVATRLRDVTLPGETVARLGGDEFGFVIPGLDDVHSAEAAAARVLSAFREPVEIQGIRLEVDASIGISLAPEHGVDVDTLMQRADIAMYHAKDADRRSSLYSHEDDQHSFDRLALLGELRRAIDEDQLRLVWMPIRSLEDRTVESIEALVRWEHPTRGTIPPGMFVPYAERTGLVRPLLLEVVEQALRQGAAWRSAGKPVRVAVNLSTRNLLDLGLPEDIRHLLERHGMPADLLELEITESTIMADPERARMVSEELDAMGVRLSIDDFGTGYSSMAYLKELPVSALKLDRSFVSQMLRGDADASIVNSTIALATNLGIDVVAEGIEDERTEAALLEMGAGYGQGFVYGVPCPAGQVDFTEEGSWRY